MLRALGGGELLDGTPAATTDGELSERRVRNRTRPVSRSSHAGVFTIYWMRFICGALPSRAERSARMTALMWSINRIRSGQ